MKPKPCEHCGVKFVPSYRVTKAHWLKCRFCSPACSVEGRRNERRSSFGKERVPLAERFWSKVAKAGEDDCWLWQGATAPGGYGYLGRSRRNPTMLAHRVSYELNVGPIAGSGMCVCHTCDNPPCVNPKHLFLGTRKDNNQDKERKGRGSDKHGERNPYAKLSREDVVAIHQFRAEGWTQQKIADKFHIAQAHVSSILAKKVWKEVSI